MTERIISTPADLDLWIKFLQSKKLPQTVSAIDGRDRTRDQNALQWLWATEAAYQLGDRTAADMQAEWKVRHGVPILREDSPTFRKTYDRYLKPLSYEEKVDVIRELDISITSAMKVRQMVRFLDAVERECVGLGLKLTDPDPDLANYQARYRGQSERKDAA